MSDNLHKQNIIEDGKYAIKLVQLEPSKYMCVLGSYLDNDTLFGRLIRWHQRGDASHTSIIFLDKKRLSPILEIHALEGWGVIATAPGALARKGARVELREVEGAPSAQDALKTLIPRLGEDNYQKPWGFITKSRRDNPKLWFCSEISNDIF